MRYLMARVAPLFLTLLWCACGGADAVAPPVPISISVTPGTPTIAIGGTISLSATVRYSDGSVSSTAVVWSSSNSSVATVGASTGIVEGIAPGTATVTASSVGLTGTAEVIVQDQAPPVVQITSPLAGSVVQGLVTVTAQTSDDHSVRRVTLSVDGIVHSTSEATGVGGEFSFVWDASEASSGSHVLMVQAWDAAGNVGSASVTVTVLQTSTHFISVNNYLRLDAVVEVNGTVLGVASAGSGVSPSFTQFTITIPAGNSITLEWGIVKVKISNTEREVGDDMGGSFSPRDNPGSQLTYNIDNIIGDATFFYPFLTNETGASGLFAFNWGLGIENRCNCTSNATGNTRFGYYRAVADSNVRAYEPSSDYTGPFSFWDKTTIGVADFRDALGVRDGYRSLRHTNIPWTSPAGAEAGGSSADAFRRRAPLLNSDDVFSLRASLLGRLATSDQDPSFAPRERR